MRWAKRAITVIAFAVVIYLFWPLIGELRKTVLLFKEARWGWILAACLIQFVSYASLTGLNYLLLRPFKGKIGYWRMMAVLSSLAFIEVAIPSAGVSGVVLRARLLGKSGYTLETSMFTVFLEAIYISSMMVIVSLTGVWYLVRRGHIHGSHWALMIGIIVIVIGIGLFVYWAGKDRKRALDWMLKVGVLWNRLLQKLNRPLISLDQIKDRVNVFFNGLDQLGKTPRWPFVATAFTRVLLDVTTLGVCFAAFHFSIAPGVLLTGFGMMLTLSGLASIPGGLGLADASLAVIFARLGAPGAVAVAAALAYRLIAFWLVRFAGFISWQILEARA